MLRGKKRTGKKIKTIIYSVEIYIEIRKIKKNLHIQRSLLRV